MPAYLVVEVTYRDHGWIEAYRRDVPALIAAYGGRYLAKSLSPQLLEGDGPAPDTLAVLEFPSLEAARAMLSSPDYRPYLEERQAGATTRMLAFE